MLYRFKICWSYTFRLWLRMEKSWIEDHPDGHSHQPEVSHHDCPHLHVYKNGVSVGIVEYKRGTF